MRVRLLNKPKPNNYTELCMVNVADRWRERNVWYPGRSVRYALKEVTTAKSSAERTEVSRGHSSREVKDRINRSLEYDSERRNGQMDVENKESCLQRDSAERKGYVRAHRSFNRIWKERDSAEPDILGKILNKDNLNRAYKRVKANKGAPGIDGMTAEEAFQWLREHNHELTERIRKGHYTPSPVRRMEIPKPDGGVRKLGIPTVIDRMKNNIEALNGWLYRRIRMCIWKQWKLPQTRMRKLIGLGVDSHYAATIANDRKGYWFNAGNKAVNWALNKERLIGWGYYDLATAYQSMHVNY